MDMKDFLTEMEESGGQLLAEGKEGDQVPKQYTEALKRDKAIDKTDYEWIYKPDDYEVVITKLKGGDEKKGGKWAVHFFTEAEVGGEEGEESLFGEGLDKILGEAEETLAVLDSVEGDFLSTVKLCIEIAQNKQFKKGATKQMVKQAKQKAK
jgi:hypothetical protein